MATAVLADMAILATDSIFGNRVTAALTVFCSGTVMNESITASSLAQHIARKNFAAQVLLGLYNGTNYKTLFINICASNQNVANDATAAGTLVGMNPAQITTAASSCTDTDINNAISAAFNSLIPNI